MIQVLGFLFFLAAPPPVSGDPGSPIHVAAPADRARNFVTFTNDLHPGNRIGYRLHEHLPLVAGKAPKTAAEVGLRQEVTSQIIENFEARPNVYRVTRPVNEEGWIPQEWTFFFAPVQDGIDILWVVRTEESGLPEYYAAQQCFRMSGKTNEAWRRTIAETPAFSEYDLWEALERQQKPLVNLSFYRSGNGWTPFPATRKKTICRTPLGRALEAAANLSEEEVQTILDPHYPADFLGDAESGLATRQSVEGDWLCGLYWEGTTHLSNHHPADCLHATVNLGPIPPKSRRAVRGKIYWSQGNLEYLTSLWARDFPEIARNRKKD